jgi:DNA-binding GntR family transcriptional regulator
MRGAAAAWATGMQSYVADPCRIATGVCQVARVEGLNTQTMKTTQKRTTKQKRQTADQAGRGQAVYEQLRGLIIRGSLAPGSPIIERPFADRLGVSRGSLRDALRRLEHEGFVSATAAGVYSRAVVTPLTVADMDDIYTLIAALNGAGARKAAELRDAERRRMADSMTVINEELAIALATPGQSSQKVYDMDHRFHMVYLGAVGGPRLHAFYDAVSSQGERYGRAYSSALGHVPAVGGMALASTEEHRAIVEAISAGDPDAAERAALINWRNAASRLRVVITSTGERGSFFGDVD